MSLVEVLVALAVAGILTLALAQMLRGTRSSEAALDRALDPLQVLDLAAELLSEEVSRAATLPWPTPAVIDDLPVGTDANGFLTPGLTITAGTHGDRVRVAYVDESVAAGPRARAVTFEAGSDATGEPQLYRRTGASTRQPLVAGVDDMTVVALVQDGAVVTPPALVVGAASRAVVVRLRSDGVTRDVVIALPGRPLVALEVIP